jgi:myo-inositol catabolism protein IolC
MTTTFARKSSLAIKLRDGKRNKHRGNEAMITGYDKPLYVLPFDHRSSYIKGLFHWQQPLTAEQAGKVAASKLLIYEGFKSAVADGVPRESAAILVDEEFGAAILREASSHTYLTCMSIEKSGQEEFDFEYGKDFERHLEDFNPTFGKVLVRYNPEGDARLNKRQEDRLRQLSEYLARTRRLFMFELLVPPQKEQLERIGGQAAYDKDLRPKLMIEAIRSLQDAGVEPDVWKIEGLDVREDCERIVEVARREGRTNVGCIVLGRGSDEQHVLTWLRTASDVPGFIGFAVGRTTWWNAMAAWHAKEISSDAAVTQIAKRFRGWAAIFEKTPASHSG